MVNIEKKVEQVNSCVETDDNERECELVLYTKPEEFSFLTKLLLAITRNEDNIYFQKWFLVTRFQVDNTFFTFEAIENTSGNIEALRTKNSMPINCKERVIVGKVLTSPRKLLTVAQEHPYNGTSAPIMASLKKCQDWFNQYVRMISPTLQLP